MNQSEKQLHKIAVIRLSSLGDIILTLPVLRILRFSYPEARIDVIVKKQYAELFQYCAYVTNIIPLDRQTSSSINNFQLFLKSLRQNRYDLVFDWHKNLRSTLLTLAIGKGKIVRYSKGSIGRRLLASTGLALGSFPRTVERYNNTLRKIGIKAAIEPPVLQLHEDELVEAASRLTQYFSQTSSANVLGIAPGARHHTKMWPLERFADLAGKFIENGLFSGVAILGDQSERTLGDRIVSVAPERIINLAGKLTIRETAAMISHLPLILTNDSGLMHMATAVDTPVAALFGPTSRELGFFPLGRKTHVIETSLSCRPCTLHGQEKCHWRNWECMLDLSVEKVVNELESFYNSLNDIQAGV